MAQVSDEEIVNLWRDKNFEGSYSGIKTFQLLLKLNKNIDLSERKLYEILKEDPIFLMHIRNKKKVQRRFYDLDYYGELLQSDLAYMFEYDSYKYFVVVCDCFSGKVFAEPLKDKSSDTVLKSLKTLVNKFETPVTKFECDQGTEYSKFKTYCKSNNIVFKYKYGKNKANFAENIIQIIKRRLYKLLRGNLIKNWPQELERVVRDHNETPAKKIGFLKPNDINSKYDSKKVRDALQTHGLEIKRGPNFDALKQNELSYDKSRGIQIGSYVYVDFPEERFGKSFDYQVNFWQAKALSHLTTLSVKERAVTCDLQ